MPWAGEQASLAAVAGCVAVEVAYKEASVPAAAPWGMDCDPASRVDY